MPFLGNAEIVQLLVNNGANIGLKDKDNKSAIDLAYSNRNIKYDYYFQLIYQN